MSTKIVVAGAAGRMGRQILLAAKNTPGVELAGAFERPGHPAVGSDAGEGAGLGKLCVAVQNSIAKIRIKNCVLVDFSEPEATLANLNACAREGAKAVVGTTGFSASQLEKIRSLSKKTALVFAPNMSIGMNLLFKLAHDAAQILGRDYDVEIMEAHHHFKKDAPSGSAKRLAEAAAEGLGLDLGKNAVYGRQGMVGERKKGEIGVHAIRAGDIVGDHTVLLAGAGERIELRHQATSRETFAQGAVRAALWVAKKSKGLYDMQDVLGII